MPAVSYELLRFFPLCTGVRRPGNLVVPGASCWVVDPLSELETAAAELCRPLADQDSLLVQLDEACESSGGLGSGRANPQKSPAALDVLELLREIDGYVNVGLRQSGYRARLDSPRVYRVKLWAAYGGRWRSTDSSYLHAAATRAGRWVVRAGELLAPDPQTIEAHAQACPSCRAVSVYAWREDLGEKVRRPALYLDKATLLVHCRCCGSQWGADMWPFLRKLLEDDAVA